MFNIENPEDLDDTLTVETLENIADAAGVTIGIRKAYGGRGMYGKTCPAITFDGDSYGSDDLLAFAAAAGMLYNDGGVDLMRDARTDSMGLGTVVYWPGAEWAEGESFDEDDDEDEDVA